jgi:hypothetical protein
VTVGGGNVNAGAGNVDTEIGNITIFVGNVNVSVGDGECLPPPSSYGIHRYCDDLFIIIPVSLTVKIKNATIGDSFVLVQIGQPDVRITCSLLYFVPWLTSGGFTSSTGPLGTSPTH